MPPPPHPPPPLPHTFVGTWHTKVRIVIQRVEVMLVGQTRVTHPIAQVVRFRVGQYVLDERARRDDVCRTLVDVVAVRHRRFLCIRAPVLRAPNVVHPVTIATGKQPNNHDVMRAFIDRN